ncbi:MAG TPA: tripartite tricarboxylate transporter TctB family protein, partial [Micropepsaceae bacterium]|nr:tripartite tricarboxylate transporter TctB family protein [Micropepsaceae bacterium]
YRCAAGAAHRAGLGATDRRTQAVGGKKLSVKQVFGTPVTDYLPALGLLALTIFYLATAYQYSADARAVPAGVAWVMLILVILDLVSRTRTAVGETLMHWLNPAGDPDKLAERKHYTAMKQIGAVLWIAAFAAAMVLIGILYAVPLYVFASLFFRGKRPLLLAIAVAAGATAMIWLLFVAVLGLELYPGMLFSGS